MSALSTATRLREWFESTPWFGVITAAFVAGWAITGDGPSWVWRLCTVLLCIDHLVEAWGNSLGLKRRFVPKEAPGGDGGGSGHNTMPPHELALGENRPQDAP